MSELRFVIVDVRVAQAARVGAPGEVLAHTVFTGAVREGDERDRTIGAAIDTLRDTLELADRKGSRS